MYTDRYKKYHIYISALPASGICIPLAVTWAVQLKSLSSGVFNAGGGAKALLKKPYLCDLSRTLAWLHETAEHMCIKLYTHMIRT